MDYTDQEIQEILNKLHTKISLTQKPIINVKRDDIKKIIMFIEDNFS